MNENRALMNGASAALFEMMLTNDDSRKKALEKEISGLVKEFNTNIG